MKTDTGDNSVFDPLAAASETEEKQPTLTPQPDEQCLYCDFKVPPGIRATHKAFHWDMEFVCGADGCPR